MSNKWYARAVSDYTANGVDVTFYEENMLQKGEESTTK